MKYLIFLIISYQYLIIQNCKTLKSASNGNNNFNNNNGNNQNDNNNGINKKSNSKQFLA